MDADQVRTVHFRLASGQLETVEVLSESGIYRALWRFSHPENRHLRRWLSHVALPALREDVYKRQALRNAPTPSGYRTMVAIPLSDWKQLAIIRVCQATGFRHACSLVQRAPLKRLCSRKKIWTSASFFARL